MVETCLVLSRYTSLLLYIELIERTKAKFELQPCNKMSDISNKYDLSQKTVIFSFPGWWILEA